MRNHFDDDGIVAGLFLGKQASVMVRGWLSVRSGIAAFPQGVGRQQLYGAALLAGIGFTMRLFVTTLGFADPDLRAGAKLAIVLDCFLSAAAGIGWLDAAQRAPHARVPEG